ncbi:MAG: helix-turn-helix domain-containing protein [Candidatus Nanoarchaeia archaeon]|nr:helix-turn-helix domain-containing protein [Candidatus Nanoarchaeia archaeon]
MNDTKITINDFLLYEKSKDINEELQYFCSSIGLFNLRDKDRSCYRIFATLLRSGSMSSDELATQLSLTRGTVIHHLNKLMEMKIVEVRNYKYLIKGNTLLKVVDDIEKEMTRMLEELKKKASEIDDRFSF